MTKKLFVPNRILAQKNINPTPSPITKAFKEEPNKNENDPSKLDSSITVNSTLFIYNSCSSTASIKRLLLCLFTPKLISV